jgi:hypothetical protein
MRQRNEPMLDVERVRRVILCVHDDRPGGDSRRVSQRPLWRIAERMFADSSIPRKLSSNAPGS